MAINLKINDLIYPYFITEGKGKKKEISLFPGVYRFSVDRLLKDIEQTADLGIDKILLFGISGKKDLRGTYAYKEGNVVADSIREIKKRFPGLVVMTDVCLCSYTSHGHCGIIKAKNVKRKAKDGFFIDNGATVKTLAKMAVSHAEAGADYVAPSAMAKRQVYAIREVLDKNGFLDVKIMGYSAKFASNFYGPFRNTADSAPKFGDRRAYQLDYRDTGKALEEIKADIKEGADIVMVKPALSYLDIIRHARVEFRNVTLAAYNVSGEYSLVKYGAQIGLLDEKKAVLEILTSIKRAGANLIISYHAKDAARWIQEEK